MQTLESSPYWKHLSKGLHEHIRGESLKESSVEYQVPNIEVENSTPTKKRKINVKPSDVRIPARLSSPLIPYPVKVREFICTPREDLRDHIHSHHSSQLEELDKTCSILQEKCIIPKAELKFDMDFLKKYGRLKYSQREDLINMATLSFARRATEHDLSIAGDTEMKFDVAVSSVSNYTSFIIMIQRLRTHIAKCQSFMEISSFAAWRGADEADYVMFSNGVYIYYSNHPEHKFFLLSCGGHFRIYHESLGYWFCGPASYLDYIFTIADILNNLDVIKNCNEYS